MKRAILALGLTVLLLPLGSDHVPAVEPTWVAFSCRHGQKTCELASISQPLHVPSAADLPAPVDVDDHTTLLLNEGVLTIAHQGQEVWTSDPSWDVRQVVTADVDDDGRREVALVLWKPFRPEPTVLYGTFGFPLLWEEGTQRNHLFVYAWRDEAWQPIWCSSPIPDPIVQIAAEDVDGDGAQELVALESSYDEGPGAPARHLSVWSWNGWGFTLRWRSPGGVWGHLVLRDVTGDGVLDVLVEELN